MLVNEFGSRLEGGRFYSYLMTKFTKPDEIFNSNSSCANAILTILNERKFHNGTDIVNVPLIMMGSARSVPNSGKNIRIKKRLNSFGPLGFW